MQLLLLLTQKFSPKVLKNQIKGKRRQFCKCSKDNWPLCTVSGRTDNSSFMTEALHLREDNFLFFIFVCDYGMGFRKTEVASQKWCQLKECKSRGMIEETAGEFQA